MTLTGVGGVGKTRLALEVAGQLADEFPNGVWFFELAAVADPAAVPEITTAIAHLREVLGDQTYESLARKGETMTTAAMVTYAYDEIGPARTDLNANRRKLGQAGA